MNRHLTDLTLEEITAVRLFQEYNAHIIGVQGYGNRANWTDLVHTDSYTDDAVKRAIATYRMKKNEQEAAKDEDKIEPTPEFVLYDRNKNRIEYYAADCYNFLRGVLKARTYYQDYKQIAQLEQELQKTQAAKLTREQRLELKEKELRNKLDQLKGSKESPETEVEKTN